jgi:GNAT superfamily N-acetyltransferase
VIDEKGEIYDLIGGFYTYGLLTLSPYFLEGCDVYEKVLGEIKEYFAEQKVLICTQYIDMVEYGYTFCNLYSSINVSNTYKVNNCSYSIIDKENINILRDAIEDIHFPDLDITKDNISFELIHGTKCNDMFLDEDYNYPIWKNEFGHSTIIGFHYLSPDFCDCHSLFVAKCEGKVVGCIKYGKYSMDNQYKHYGLNYIDVNENYRRRGIAKMLIEEFAKILGDDMPLCLSDESDMGELCQMEKHFKNANFKTNVYAYSERSF